MQVEALVIIGFVVLIIGVLAYRKKKAKGGSAPKFGPGSGKPK